MTKRKFPDGPRQLPGKPPRLFVEVGQRIGRSVVIDANIRIPVPERNGRKSCRAVRLICDCGNEYVRPIYEVVGGSRTGCGCGLRKPRRGAAPDRAARNWVLGSYRTGAKNRGLAWELTEEEFDRLTSQDCYYCGSPPGRVKKSDRKYVSGDFIYTGIDRIDNSLGYTLGNVVPCCTICNRAKHALSYDEFMAWVARLTAHHWFHPELTPSSLLKRSA